MSKERPSTRCDMCGGRIFFDGFIRNPKGMCFPLNADYSIHSCGNSALSPEQVEKRTIRYLQMLVKKMARGLPDYDIELAVKAKIDGKPLSEELTPKEELLIASGPYDRI